MEARLELPDVPPVDHSVAREAGRRRRADGGKQSQTHSAKEIPQIPCEMLEHSALRPVKLYGNVMLPVHALRLKLRPFLTSHAKGYVRYIHKATAH